MLLYGQNTSVIRMQSFWYMQNETPEKAMAPNSSTLAWKIPWTEEPGRLQSMGSLRVGHDRATSLSLFSFMHWRRKWQPTPVILPGESQGRGRLVGCRLWGCTESDTTDTTQQQQQQNETRTPESKTRESGNDFSLYRCLVQGLNLFTINIHFVGFFFFSSKVEKSHKIIFSS